MHRLNLRDTAATTSATFGSIARRRKRSQRIRSKRQTRSLSSIALNSALAQDVMTGELLLSDSVSGDIMRCNLMDNNCMVEVDHADLLTTTGRGSVGMCRGCVHVCMLKIEECLALKQRACKTCKITIFIEWSRSKSCHTFLPEVIQIEDLTQASCHA